MYLLKMSGPQIWLCLFTFRPIASKELNSLTTIETLCWLGGAVVMHPLWVQEVPGSIPGSCKGILCLNFCFVVKESQRKPNFSCLYIATDVSHHLHVSSHYRWYGGFGLASMVLLVAVCAGLGLGLGLYAREGDAMPYERGRLSNCGGCCLVT